MARGMSSLPPESCPSSTLGSCRACCRVGMPWKEGKSPGVRDLRAGFEDGEPKFSVQWLVEEPTEVLAAEAKRGNSRFFADGTAKNQRDGRGIAVHHQGYMGNQHMMVGDRLPSW